jgi:hypothetical protein
MVGGPQALSGDHAHDLSPSVPPYAHRSHLDRPVNRFVFYFICHYLQDHYMCLCVYLATSASPFTYVIPNGEKR